MCEFKGMSGLGRSHSRAESKGKVLWRVGVGVSESEGSRSAWHIRGPGEVGKGIPIRRKVKELYIRGMSAQGEVVEGSSWWKG